jgi:hypothetical protein
MITERLCCTEGWNELCAWDLGISVGEDGGGLRWGVGFGMLDVCRGDGRGAGEIVLCC